MVRGGQSEVVNSPWSCRLKEPDALLKKQKVLGRLGWIARRKREKA